MRKNFYGRRTFGSSNTKSELISGAIKCGIAIVKCGIFIGGVWAKEKIEHSFWEKKRQCRDSSNTSANKGQPSSSDKTDHKQKPAEETLNDTLNKHINMESTQLLGNLIHSGETCVLYSHTDAGKSTLAMQIGIDIAGGNKSKLLPDTIAGIPQTVYYYDTELRDMDIQHRYKGKNNSFPSNFIRLSNCHFASLDDWADDMEEKVGRTETDCTIIFDNITQGGGAHNARAVNDFYNRLENLKSKYMRKGRHITIIIVTHTSKSNSVYNPIEFRDMSGSSALYNFANSVIALGMTGLGEDKRMLKALKGKFTAKTGDVVIVRFVETPYLHFEYVCSRPECEVLPTKPKVGRPGNQIPSAPDTKKKTNSKVTPEIIKKMKQMADSGMSQGKIGHKLNISRRTVNKILKQSK